MSFSINTNIASLQAQNYLQKSSNFQSKTINRVTSGLRIVNSGDDAAGLAIANGLRSDQSVLNQGIANANDGVATLQTIDSGMSNISTLLDRARTLATQSASGTFTGDRSTLNNEFQSVVSEIDRQAQSIGMNQGGQFAKAMSVFIGGGKGQTSTQATTNGSVALDLSHSSVDAQSLGLKGVQARGADSVDLSAASATSVQHLIADLTNKGSEATAGFTNFTFKGAGFSDGNAINISVNLAGVTDSQTLAAAINSAIQTSGNGTTAAATAFKNANISASVVNDSNGGEHLAFTSSSSAFQVQAGDRTSNALLGNISGGTTGAALTTTFAGASNLGDFTTTKAAQAETVKLQFQGAGMTSPETVSLNIASGDSLGSVVTALTSAVANDSTLAKAGITLDTANSITGQKLQFKSTSGQQFSVAVGGDAQNLLGLGSLQLGSTGNAVQYGSTTASSTYIAASATNTKGTANFEFSFNGASAASNAIAVDLGAGDATAGVNTGTDTNLTVDTSVNKNLKLSVDGTVVNITLAGAATGQAATKTAIAANITSQLASAGSTATASVDNSNHIVITSGTKGAGSSVQVLSAASGDAASVLGLSGSGTQGVSRSGGDVANNINQQIAANSTLAAAGLKASYDGVLHKLTVASTNNTNFQLNAFGSSSAAAITGTQTGTAATATFTLATAVTTADSNITVNVDGNSYKVGLTTGAISAATVASDINKAVGASVASVNSGSLVLTSTTPGASSAVSISAGTASDAATTLGINGLTNAGGASAPGVITGSATGPVEITGANYQVKITSNGNAHTINLTQGSRTMSQIATEITAGLGADGSASVDGAGHLVVTTAGNNQTVTVNAATANDGLSHFTAGATTAGSAGFTIGASNNSLSFKLDGGSTQNITIDNGTYANASLLAANIQSKLTAANITGVTVAAASGAIKFTDANAGSNRSIQFVTGGANDVSSTLGVNATAVSGTDANVGFGFQGSSFTGNTQGAAPATSPDVLSAGSYQTASLSFSALGNGSDNQTINVTAVDGSGAYHTSNIVLKNNSLGQTDSNTGASIDSALKAINDSLQQSNVSALQNVSAVKYNDAGVEKIKFQSGNTKFSVTVGNTGDGSGISNQGTTVNASVAGTGGTSDISSIEGAQAAVNALATAVQNLGTAQAAVGKGQNNLNYAVSLATSQTTNEAAAESQIRDANLAQEAANLSRAQILVQAGTAALAQANSAPQQLLSLLRG